MTIGLLALAGAGAAVATTAAGNPQPAANSAGSGPASELRPGYLGNITHAPALVGVNQGFIQENLGSTKLSTQVFNAGPAAVEALNAGAIDATYIGPNPAINSFVKSHGESISIIAGAASGGAQLVVKPDIKSPADLKGKTLASPQLGGTQDVALRSWLAQQGFKTNPDGGGDVAINPTENAQTLKLFLDGKLDGAWLRHSPGPRSRSPAWKAHGLGRGRDRVPPRTDSRSCGPSRSSWNLSNRSGWQYAPNQPFSSRLLNAMRHP